MGRRSPDQKHLAVLYPAFDNLDELVSHYHRLLWYLPASSGYEIHLFHTRSLALPPTSVLSDCPPHLVRQTPAEPNIILEPWSPSRFAALAAVSQTIGLWKVRSAKPLDKLSVACGRKFVVIDADAKGTWEFARYATILYDHLSRAEKQLMRRRSRDVLAGAAAELAPFRKAYVFGTGPSLARATDFSYDDGVRIVCNSIVRNPDLLDHIKPHFIAASDFVFHFGPSSYAHQFRNDLIAAMVRTGAYLLIPEQLAPLMLAHYPHIADRTIALPLTNRFDFREFSRPANVQLMERFKVRTLDSVLNLLMLPVASTLADDIFILGCDGRAPTDAAFWSHHQSSQYGGLMGTVNQTHPGFFEIDYLDYYARYCSHVALVIAAGEALGKRYASLVPSYIPALADRPTARKEVLSAEY
jgi:hypothetical protein